MGDSEAHRPTKATIFGQCEGNLGFETHHTPERIAGCRNSVDGGEGARDGKPSSPGGRQKKKKGEDLLKAVNIAHQAKARVLYTQVDEIDGRVQEADGICGKIECDPELRKMILKKYLMLKQERAGRKQKQSNSRKEESLQTRPNTPSTATDVKKRMPSVEMGPHSKSLPSRNDAQGGRKEVVGRRSEVLEKGQHYIAAYPRTKPKHEKSSHLLQPVENEKECSAAEERGYERDSEDIPWHVAEVLNIAHRREQIGHESLQACRLQKGSSERVDRNVVEAESKNLERSVTNIQVPIQVCASDDGDHGNTFPTLFEPVGLVEQNVAYLAANC